MFTISIDPAVLFTYASLIITALWPVMGISAGFTLGFGIMNMLISAIGSAVRR